MKLYTVLVALLLVEGHAQSTPGLTRRETTMIPEESVAPPSPSAIAAKRGLCERDFEGYNNALRLVTVHPQKRLPNQPEDGPIESPSSNTTAKYPRIFCYVNTIAEYHASRSQYIAETWGQRCDKLVFLSNEAGTVVINEGTEFQREFPIVKIDEPADYVRLWLKHRACLKYIYDHYRNDYDWFYKADDDAYLVVDNLREYLQSPEIAMNNDQRPLFLGKRFRLPEAEYHRCGQNDFAIAEYLKEFGSWIYNTGGPGYAMNQLFLDAFVASMDEETCLGQQWAGKVECDDPALAFCMRWHGVEPLNTDDENGRPRWHGFNPATVYG